MELIGIEKVSELVKMVNEAKNIVITAHKDPDGDAIGSCLAVYNLLKEYLESKQINIVIQEVPERFKILEGYSVIQDDFKDDIDLLIVLDLNESDRLRKLGIFN